MPKAKNPKVDEAYELFKQGFKLIDISKKLDLPEGTVRRWKCTYGWGGSKNERSQKNKTSVRKRGAPKGNKNAVGNSGGGAPKGNHNAMKHGFLSRYIPAETMELIRMTNESSPIELLWDQIQIAYAAIIRAQQIAFVKDQDDKTQEIISESDNATMYQIEQAWQKHEAFMTAQARAQAELARMIKQYDEMLKSDESATDEQKARLELLKGRISTEKLRAEEIKTKTEEIKLKSKETELRIKAAEDLAQSEEEMDDGFIDALNASAREDWSDEEEE